MRWTTLTSLVDGLFAVPVDMETLDGSVVLDGLAQEGHARATVTFRLGSAGGMPIFNLRQTPVLIYDRFTFGLALELRSDTEHEVISNADVFALGAGRWQLEFPPSHTALSPMLVLRPRADLVTERRTEVFSNGQSGNQDPATYPTCP